MISVSIISSLCWSWSFQMRDGYSTVLTLSPDTVCCLFFGLLCYFQELSKILEIWFRRLFCVLCLAQGREQLLDILEISISSHYWAEEWKTFSENVMWVCVHSKPDALTLKIKYLETLKAKEGFSNILIQNWRCTANHIFSYNSYKYGSFAHLCNCEMGR